MKPTSPRLILALSYLTYLLFGGFTAAIGPVLGELADQTASTLAAIGGVLTFLFVGAIMAQVASGPITDRFGHKAVLVASLLVLALGMLGFTNAASLPLMFALVLVAGLGQGGVDMGANLVVADVAPRNTTSALNLLHFFFGLGAFIGPAIAGLSIALLGSGLPVHWITAVLFILLGLAIAILLPAGSHTSPGEMQPRESAPVSFKVYLSPLLWMLGLLLLIYVGVEIALGSWITSYMGITTGMLPQFGAWVTSAYWAGLALGRLAGAAASRRLSRLQLLAVSLGGSLLGGIGLFAAQGLAWPTIISLVWIGFAYAPVYPTAVALTAAQFSGARGKAVSVIVALGSLGAALFPLAAGALLEGRAGSGLPWLVGLGLLSLLLVLGAISLLIRRRSRTAGVPEGAAH